MGHVGSLRHSVDNGFAGGGPTTPSGRGGESPSFILHSSEAQLEALADFVSYHGFWSHQLDHEVSHTPTWSTDLYTVEELLLECSCGVHVTFDRQGEEVI